MIMEKTSDRFVYFSIQKDGTIKFKKQYGNAAEFILPRQPETGDLDVYYLQSMLKYFDPSNDILENEILDAFPVLSLTKDKNDKFYKLSVYRLRDFYKNEIEEDEYIQASVKHLYMYSLLAKPTNQSLNRVLKGCLDKVQPVMYERDKVDTVDCEAYELSTVASYVPTARYRRMKLLKGWIEGALHYYDYSIMFLDNQLVGFNDFSENIIDIKTTDLVRPAMFTRYNVNIYEYGAFALSDSGLYYESNLQMYDLRREWLLTSPNNDNERDGKVMMFRNRDLKMRLEEILARLFLKNSFRLNDVFKWNRYSNGGQFDSHYDTMYVNKSSEECSLYTLLLYLEVQGDSFMYLYEEDGETEVQVRLSCHKAYVIPHWVKHRVQGVGLREFIKTEIILKNKDIGTTYHETLAKAFDQSCYYMLQSVRHPELKDIVSKNFNTINEARFYKTVYLPKLKNNIFILKTIKCMPLLYLSIKGKYVNDCDQDFNYVTDGIYYYFKLQVNYMGGRQVVSPNDAIMILSIMQFDLQPKKMFTRHVIEYECVHSCVDYHYSSSDFDIEEDIAYWEPKALELKLDGALLSIPFARDMDKIVRVGNIFVPDIHENPDTFYFAACLHRYRSLEFDEGRLSEITSGGRDGDYSNINVDFIGPHKNILKIRRRSFKNGVVVTRKWIGELKAPPFLRT